MVGELDSYSMKDLETRYGIARSNIYNRINNLKSRGYDLEPETIGNRAIYSANQVMLMDRFDRHLRAGGNIGNFPTPDQLDSSYAEQDTAPLSRRTQDIVNPQRGGNEKDDLQIRLPGTVGERLADRFLQGLAIIFPPPLPPARKGLELAPYRELAEAAREGYELSTQNVANLLGVKASTIANYGERFEDAGFVFRRVGRRKGGQIAWLVSKIKRQEQESFEK